MLQFSASVRAWNSTKHKISKNTHTFRYSFLKVHLSATCTFSGIRSERTFAERSIHWGIVQHCLPAAHSRNCHGLRARLVCPVSKCVLQLCKRKKIAWNKLFQTAWKSRCSHWSSFSATAWGYIISIPVERSNP